MYRFLSLAWNPENPEKTDTSNMISRKFQDISPHWSSVFDRPGLMVFHLGEQQERMQAYPLKNQGGVILGRLFNRHPDNQNPGKNLTFNDGGTEKLPHDPGRYLIENYWGRYVAFLTDEEINIRRIIRDPTGGFPCFFIRYRGVDIYFSHMADCTRLGLLTFTVNWNYITAYLKFPLVQRGDSGLCEVSELLPGEGIKIAADRRTKHFYWDPKQFAAGWNIEDPVKAAQMLRQTTGDCITAWAASYQNILHSLSGGLDSSITLNRLRQASSRLNITCLNYFTPTPDGDERVYARLAAGQAQCRLIEEEISASKINFGQLSGLTLSPKPADYLYQLEHSQYEAGVAKDTGAQAIFTGAGGDGIFFQPRTDLGVVDYIKHHGLSSHLFTLALESACLQNSSLWSVLGTAFKYGLFDYPSSPYDGLTTTSPLLNPELLNDMKISDIVHPWLVSAEDVPHGKRLHILALAAPPTYYDPLGQADLPEPVYPLISQPIIELCLRIPIWILTSKGVDRGLVRQAFRNDVPREILARQTKGGINDHYKNIIETHSAFIREYLLDGILIKQGFIDRGNLERTLSGHDLPTGREHLDIMTYVSLEAWLRSWHNPIPERFA